MLQELQLLFTEMGPAAAVCLIAGLIFIIIELIIPGFGFFGITGGLLLLAGIILRLIDGGNGNPVAQFFLMLLILILILGAAFGLVALAAKKGWLNRTFLVDTGRAVPEGHTEGTKDYSGLIGKTGTTATMLRPAGIASISRTGSGASTRISGRRSAARRKGTAAASVSRGNSGNFWRCSRRAGRSESPRESDWREKVAGGTAASRRFRSRRS